MKHYILVILFVGVAATAKSQQLQTSSMYDMQGVLHNPSTAGVYQHGMVGTTYRSQWSGISGSPKTATVFGSFDLPKHNIGVGGYLFSDKTGPTSRTGMEFAFAKHIPLKNGARFSLGIEARGEQYSIDRAKLSQTLGSDPALGTSYNKFKFDAGFGISYTGRNCSSALRFRNWFSQSLIIIQEHSTPTKRPDCTAIISCMVLINGVLMKALLLLPTFYLSIYPMRRWNSREVYG